MPTSKLSTTNKKALILGAGYLGQRLIQPLHELGYLVDTVTRSSSLDSQEIHQHYYCTPNHHSISSILKESQPDLIVICWAPGSRKGGTDTYQKTYWDRLVELRLALFQDHRPKHIIYTSSTSVFHEQNGELKDETSPPKASTERSKILIQAEREVMSWSKKYDCTTQILRCSGIFGPERQPGLRLLQNNSMIPGNSEAWVNLVHVDDIVQATLKALQLKQNGIWNISSITTKRDELYQHIAKANQLNTPIWEKSEQENIGRRIDAQLAKSELDWQPNYTDLSSL